MVSNNWRANRYLRIRVLLRLCYRLEKFSKDERHLGKNHQIDEYMRSNLLEARDLIKNVASLLQNRERLRRIKRVATRLPRRQNNASTGF